jgi:hypothetical protein
MGPSAYHMGLKVGSWKNMTDFNTAFSCLLHTICYHFLISSTSNVTCDMTMDLLFDNIIKILLKHALAAKRSQ